jgi:hypothetical protein
MADIRISDEGKGVRTRGLMKRMEKEKIFKSKLGKEGDI